LSGEVLDLVHKTYKTGKRVIIFKALHTSGGNSSEVI